MVKASLVRADVISLKKKTKKEKRKTVLRKLLLVDKSSIHSQYRSIKTFERNVKASRIASVLRLLSVIDLEFSMHVELQASINYIVTKGCQSTRREIPSNFEFKRLLEMGRDYS